MLHRIREAMRTGTFEKLSGTVEADETFIGGEARNMHKHKREKRIKGRGTVGKASWGFSDEQEAKGIQGI